jgi:hypothetical protein
MADAQENIRIRLIAADDASPAIREVAGALERLGAGLNLGPLGQQFGGLTASLTALAGARTEASALSTVVGELSASVTGQQAPLRDATGLLEAWTRALREARAAAAETRRTEGKWCRRSAPLPDDGSPECACYALVLASLATVVIGGLLSSMLLTLVVAIPGSLQERIHTPHVGHSGILDEEKLVGLQFI